MKKLVLLAFISSGLSVSGQTKQIEKDTVSGNFNKWTIEISAGQMKGVSPYADGYYSSNPDKFFGNIDVNSFTLGARYALGPKFGLKTTVSYDQLKNLSNKSLPFKMQQIGISFQGVINANRLFNIEEELGRFGILIHAGVKIDQLKSKTENTVDNFNYDKKELNGGLIIGLTPQYRISNRIAIFGDVTVQNNFRQHFNWDGSFSNLSTNNMKGQSVMTSIGLSFSIGDNEIHGDWSVIKDAKIIEIEALSKRIDDNETLMNDTDKDGIPDYLDQENNSVAGVAVDSRGKMVDINRNGVPDELERYVNSSIQKERNEIDSEDTLKKLINGGYIAVYFETGKSVPTNLSTDGLNFIRTYLRANPDKSIYILGHADAMGLEVENKKLSEERAIATKNILIKSGIAEKRLLIKAEGQDDSVDRNSDISKSMVRKVTFKIIE